jgi:hypothetical protein
VQYPHVLFQHAAVNVKFSLAVRKDGTGNGLLYELLHYISEKMQEFSQKQTGFEKLVSYCVIKV